jgi:hypothetical protein
MLPQSKLRTLLVLQRIHRGEGKHHKKRRNHHRRRSHHKRGNIKRKDTNRNPSTLYFVGIREGQGRNPSNGKGWKKVAKENKNKVMSEDLEQQL